MLLPLHPPPAVNISWHCNRKQFGFSCSSSSSLSSRRMGSRLKLSLWETSARLSCVWASRCMRWTAGLCGPAAGPRSTRLPPTTMCASPSTRDQTSFSSESVTGWEMRSSSLLKAELKLFGKRTWGVDVCWVGCSWRISNCYFMKKVFLHMKAVNGLSPSQSVFSSQLFLHVWQGEKVKFKVKVSRYVKMCVYVSLRQQRSLAGKACVSRMVVDKYVYLNKAGTPTVEVWDKRSERMVDCIDCAQIIRYAHACLHEQTFFFSPWSAVTAYQNAAVC